MKDLFDIVNESRMLCEAFNDPRIYQAWKTLQRYKIKWDELFGSYGSGNNIAWSNIPPEAIEEIEPSNIEKLFKSIRRDKRGYEERPFVLLGFKAERLQYVYDSYLHRFGMLTSYGPYNKGAVTWLEGNNKNHSYNYMPERDQFNYLKSCDYILKVYSDITDTRQLKNDRRDAIAGSWQMSQKDHTSKHRTPGVLGKEAGGLDKYSGGDFYQMCTSMAQQAIAKYKEIIAENKFARSQDTSEVDNAVDNIMRRITTATSNAMKDPDKYSPTNTKVSLETLMKRIYDQERYVAGSGRTKTGYYAGRDGLLIVYQRFCEACVNLKKKSNYYHDADHYLEVRDVCKAKILKIVAVLDEMLKKFDA